MARTTWTMEHHGSDNMEKLRIGIWVRELCTDNGVKIDDSTGFAVIAKNHQNVCMGQPTLLELNNPSVGNSVAKNSMLDKVIKECFELELEDADMKIIGVGF